MAVADRRQSIVSDRYTSRVIVTGDFSILAQFGDKELTAVGDVDAYVASIIPKL